MKKGSAPSQPRCVTVQLFCFVLLFSCFFACTPVTRTKGEGGGEGRGECVKF